MDDWEKFNETSLPEKEEFYSNLNMEDITDQITCMQKEFVKTLKYKFSVNIMICFSEVKHNFWLMFLKFLKICV